MALFKDIQASLDVNPASDTAQALLARWQALIDELTGGHRGIEQAVGKAWSDRENWPSQMRAQSEPFMDARVWQFISRAREARGR